METRVREADNFQLAFQPTLMLPKLMACILYCPLFSLVSKQQCFQNLIYFPTSSVCQINCSLPPWLNCLGAAQKNDYHLFLTCFSKFKHSFPFASQDFSVFEFLRFISLLLKNKILNFFLEAEPCQNSRSLSITCVSLESCC